MWTAEYRSPTAPDAPVVRVTEMGGRGRGMVCSQPLKAGQIVLRDSPILMYPALPLHPSSHVVYCSHCFRKVDLINGATFPCLSCSLAFFCSLGCRQSSSSSSHTPWLCEALIRLAGFPPFLQLDLDRQYQVRFLVSAYNLAAVSPSDFRLLLSLHGTCNGDDDTLAHILHPMLSVFSNPPCNLSMYSLRTTADLLEKDKLNSFSIMAPFSPEKGRTVRAYGIYPNASFFNHDCLPNACRFDYVDSAGGGNTDVIIRAIHDVPEGREVCLSYFPVNSRYPERQKWLIEDYGFSCDCDRCKVESTWSDDEDDDDEVEGMDAMDEDEDDGAMAAEAEVDFPHAYFFLKYMCDGDNCWGTLSPLPPPLSGAPSTVTECNVCGRLKKVEDDPLT